MRYSYYPGCTLKTRAKELDRYARLSLQALGVEIEELKEWQCCGAVYPMAKDEIATRLSAVGGGGKTRAARTPQMTQRPRRRHAADHRVLGLPQRHQAHQ